MLIKLNHNISDKFYLKSSPYNKRNYINNHNAHTKVTDRENYLARKQNLCHKKRLF
jgi:hypothetical protein